MAHLHAPMTIEVGGTIEVEVEGVIDEEVEEVVVRQDMAKSEAANSMIGGLARVGLTIGEAQMGITTEAGEVVLRLEGMMRYRPNL